MNTPPKRPIAILRSFVRGMDRVTERTGTSLAWLCLALALTICFVVLLRYGARVGSIAMQESATYMHAMFFMLGTAFALRRDGHVRVDIFYRSASELRRAWVDLIGVLIFLLPMCGYLAYASWDFAAASWSIRESSREPGGLAYPLIPMLKSVVVLMPVAVGLQGISLLLRSLARIRGKR